MKVDCFAEMDESYASGAGPAGVAKTNYSARFVKTINEGAGSYVFTITADDGAKLIIDGVAQWTGWSKSKR